MYHGNETLEETVRIFRGAKGAIDKPSLSNPTYTRCNIPSYTRFNITLSHTT